MPGKRGRPGKDVRAVGVLVLAGLRGRRRSGLVVTFGVLLLSAFGLCAGLVVTGGGSGSVDRLAARANVAKVVLRQDGKDAAAHGPLAGLDAVPGVRTVVGPLATGDSQLILGGKSNPVQITALDNPAVPVNRPLPVSGRWARGPGEIVIERSAARDLRLHPGSTVILSGTHGPVAYTVAGVVTDLTDCPYPTCGSVRTFTTRAGFARLGASDAPQYWLDVTGDPNVVAEALQTRYAGRIGGSDTWSNADTRGDILRPGEIFGRFVSVFGGFLLVACAVVVAGSITTRMVERRRELALLGAIGFRRGQVVAALIGEEVAIGAAAGVVGWVAAGFVAPYLDPEGAPLGRSAMSWPAVDLLVTLLVVALVLVVSTALPAVRAGRRPLTELLRDDVSRAGAAGPIGLLTSRVPRRLALLGLGPLAARPTRSALGAVAVVIALVGAIVGTGFVATVGVAVRQPARTGDPWNVSVQPSTAAADRVVSVLRSEPRVASWYTETDRPAALDGHTFRSRALGGSPPRYVLGAGRLPSGAHEAIVGYGLLREFGLRIGASREIRVEGRPVTVRIVGWYRETEDTGDILAWRLADLRALEPGATPDAYQVTAAGSVSPAALATSLSARFGPSVQVRTFSSDLGSSAAFEGTILFIAVLVAAVAFANLLAALLTSGAQDVRILGVEQALGFTRRQLVGQRALGAGVLGVAAAALGVPLGLMVFHRLADLVTAGIGAGPGFGSAPDAASLAAFAVAAPLLCALLGAFAAARVLRRPITTTLRWE
jgi:putative ABC transport system permease protein